MDPRLHAAARSGAIDSLRQLVQENRYIFDGVTHLKETAIHVALRHERFEFVQEIINHHPLLLIKPNIKGDTPLHYALKAGYHNFFLQCLQHDLFLQCLNADLQASQDIETGHDLSFLKDNAGRSLLYLAAEAGSPAAVTSLLQSPVLGAVGSGPNGFTALHAAVFQQDVDMAKKIIARHQPFTKQGDAHGNTPLHHAACLDRLRMVELLVQIDASTAYILNEDGFSPVHLTVKLGLCQIFQRIMELCPESGLMTTNKGRNVLHLSIQARMRDIMKFILKSPNLTDLINERDDDGNTPFHVAGSNEIYRGPFRVLNNEERVAKSVRNNEGLTCKDISILNKKFEKSIKPFWSIPRFRKNKLPMGPAGIKYLRVRQRREQTGENHQEKSSNKEMKGFVSSLLVVSTLIATVTFAAAYTIPGGYSNDKTDEGMATLAKRAALQAFLVADSTSMCSSMAAAFLLIRAGFVTNPFFPIDFIWGSTVLLAIAVASMAVAFATGIFLVIESQCRWLAILIVIVVPCYLLSAYIFTNYLEFKNLFGLNPIKKKLRW